MQLIRCLLSNIYRNMFRASLCPSSGEQDRALSWAVCTQLTTQLHTTTANHSQHNQCRTSYAVVHGLVLLMMGIMMPETCCDRCLIINIELVASCWFLSLSSTYILLHVSSTTVFIIRRSKLYYTASGIVTHCRWPSGAQVGRVLSQIVPLHDITCLYCIH